MVGHFRNYASGQNYEGHNSFTFYKNESLYELYYLTGERWYHDVGLMSSDFAMARWAVVKATSSRSAILLMVQYGFSASRSTNCDGVRDAAPATL